MRMNPASTPTSGEITMNESVWIHFVPQVIALQPAFATPAPA